MGISTNYTLYRETQNMNMKFSHFAFAELNSSWRRKAFITASTRCYMILDGEGEIWCNNEHIVMTPGNIYFIPAGIRFSFSCKQHLVKLYFNAELYNRNRESITITNSNCIVLTDRQDTIQKMTELYRNRSDYLSAFELRICSEQLLLEALQVDSPDRPIINYSSLIQKALQFINKNPRIDNTADILAKGLHTSPAVLRTKFKKEVGTPIGQYQRLRVLQQAATDLEQTNLSLAVISEKYGFCDQFYFSRVFSAHFGIPPSKYKKDHII